MVKNDNTIPIKNKYVRYSNGIWKSDYVFHFRAQIDHLKTGLVQYSDGLYSGAHIRSMCQLLLVIASYIYNYEHIITQLLISTMEHLIRV
jgi:hypothetical protein